MNKTGHFRDDRWKSSSATSQSAKPFTQPLTGPSFLCESWLTAGRDGRLGADSDVYPAGMGDAPAFRDDTITLAQGQKAIVEFTLPSYGRYMFHPHRHWLADRGAMGSFAPVCFVTSVFGFFDVFEGVVVSAVEDA